MGPASYHSVLPLARGRAMIWTTRIMANMTPKHEARSGKLLAQAPQRPSRSESPATSRRNSRTSGHLKLARGVAFMGAKV
eukprot:12947351-Alexandrium_andersonii.AAC.1